jgi:hypothetical protein
MKTMFQKDSYINISDYVTMKIGQKAREGSNLRKCYNSAIIFYPLGK